MPVAGIGGVFFRASDPKALQAWYAEHLGLVVDYKSPWTPPSRVTELDALLATLRGAGVAVTTNPDWDMPQTGRFAHIHDPEGKQIELWEQPAD